MKERTLWTKAGRLQNRVKNKKVFRDCHQQYLEYFSDYVRRHELPGSSVTEKGFKKF